MIGSSRNRWRRWRDAPTILERGDYNAEAVEHALQCEGERYALSMAEATTVQPNMATANATTKVNFFIMTLPDSTPVGNTRSNWLSCRVRLVLQPLRARARGSSLIASL